MNNKEGEVARNEHTFSLEKQYELLDQLQKRIGDDNFRSLSDKEVREEIAMQYLAQILVKIFLARKDKRN